MARPKTKGTAAATKEKGSLETARRRSSRKRKAIKTFVAEPSRRKVNGQDFALKHALEVSLAYEESKTNSQVQRSTAKRSSSSAVAKESNGKEGAFKLGGTVWVVSIFNII